MDIYAVTAQEEGLRAARLFMETAQRPVIVHLSDTFTGTYDMAVRLLEIVRPDLTIHTGDMADEYKAGRIEAHIPDYCAHVPGFLRQIERLSNQVWLTPGNNDIPSVLAEHGAHTTLWPNGARVEAFGVRIELDHYPIPVTTGVDFAMYGHGPTDDLRYPLPDAPENVIYLNGNFHFTIIETKTKRFVRIPFRWRGRYRRLFFACCIDEMQKETSRRKARYLAKTLLETRFSGCILYAESHGAWETANELAQHLMKQPHAECNDARMFEAPLETLLTDEKDILFIGDRAKTQMAVESMLRKCKWKPERIPECVPGCLSIFRIVDYVSLACHVLQLHDCAHMPMSLAGQFNSH